MVQLIRTAARCVLLAGIVTLGTASGASALTASNYCGGSVNRFPSAYRCYADGAVAHTWNFNENYMSVYSNDICAYISSGLDGSGAISGSGCVPGSYYGFCHTPVTITRVAFAEHFNDSASYSMYPNAQTGRTCSAAIPQATMRATAPVGFAGSGASPTPPAQLMAMTASADINHPDLGADGQSARSAGSTGDVFIVPSATGVCASRVGEDNVVLACTDTLHANAVTAVTEVPGGFVAWGVAADPATKAVVTFDDGSKSIVPVRANGFEAVFQRAPSSITAR
jgi:hypothetical protein